MYILLVLSFSALFSQVAERTLRAQLDEEITAILRSAGNLDPESYDSLRQTTRRDLIARDHLNEPWPSRVLWRTWSVLSFQFGQASTVKSATGERDVLGLILEALPNTLILFGTEAVLVMALGTLVGLRAATRRKGLLDRVLSFLPMLLKGLPAWWLGMLAMLALAYALPLFPSGGIHSNPLPSGLAGAVDLLWHLFLPLLVLVALNLWGFALEVRNLLADLTDSPWITAARARGVPERSILLRHILAGARPALLTLVVMGLLQSLSGNLLLEGIFGWPGLGNLYFIAVQQSDVPVLLGVLSFQTFLNLVGLVGLDITYRRLDPRLDARDRA